MCMRVRNFVYFYKLSHFPPNLCWYMKYRITLTTTTHFYLGAILAPSESKKRLLQQAFEYVLSDLRTVVNADEYVYIFK